MVRLEILDHVQKHDGQTQRSSINIRLTQPHTQALINVGEKRRAWCLLFAHVPTANHMPHENDSKPCGVQNKSCESIRHDVKPPQISASWLYKQKPRLKQQRVLSWPPISHLTDRLVKQEGYTRWVKVVTVPRLAMISL